MTSIQPELWVEPAGEAAVFYAKAFGARVLHQVGEGGDSVAQLAVGEAAFWVAAACQRVAWPGGSPGGCAVRAAIDGGACPGRGVCGMMAGCVC